jgi:CRISPR/Cas system CSM-associated protein Csm3 (group 7 of RAMP superfamily)
MAHASHSPGPARPAEHPSPVVARVPLAPGAIERRDPLLRRQGHDRFTPGLLTGRLEGRLVALTPLHVDAGGIERAARVAPAFAETTPLLRPCLRLHGVPIVPGSTLKGAVRSVVEAIAPACLGVRVRATAGPHAPALPPALQALDTCRRRAGRPATLCIACRLFGTIGYQGRVRFADARLQEGNTAVMGAPVEPAPRALRGALGRQVYRHGRPAAGPVPLEVCPVGSTFDLVVHFVNLQPAELGLLLTALGVGLRPFALKLGGYKPACFGSVQVEVTRLSADDPLARYRRYLEDAAAAPAAAADLTPYLQALRASDLLLVDRLERVAGLLRYPGDGACGSEEG